MLEQKLTGKPAKSFDKFEAKQGLMVPDLAIKWSGFETNKLINKLL
jgi:hypothetical protein